MNDRGSVVSFTLTLRPLFDIVTPLYVDALARSAASKGVNTIAAKPIMLEHPRLEGQIRLIARECCMII